MWPATSVPVEIGVTRYPSWYPYIRSSRTCRPPDTIEPMKIARHTTAGPEVRQVVEVRIRLEAHGGAGGRASGGAETSCQICRSADSSASKEKRSVLSPMNEGAGPDGDSPNGSTQTPR